LQLERTTNFDNRAEGGQVDGSGSRPLQHAHHVLGKIKSRVQVVDWPWHELGERQHLVPSSSLGLDWGNAAGCPFSLLILELGYQLGVGFIEDVNRVHQLVDQVIVLEEWVVE
jgi:hypothetical protein